MKGIIIFVVIILVIVALLIWKYRTKGSERFYSYEHIMTADGQDLINYGGITLSFPKGNIQSKNKKFKLSNGNELTFGQLIALSGDYFGTQQPVSSGSSLIEQQKNFMSLVDTINRSPSSDKWADSFGVSANVIPKVLNTLAFEKSKIDDAIRIGKPTSKAYAETGFDLDVRSNKDTGGGDTVSKSLASLVGIDAIELIPYGRYMELASFNWDHFGNDCWKAYYAGHTVAMMEAAKGNLEYAYILEAIACHFLTDSFSSGHIATPRKELHYGTGSIPPWSTTIGDLLSKLMHDEGNRNGLTVANNACYSKVPEINKLCSKWTAYGDTVFAEPKNKENLININKALQLSVNEVYQSYLDSKPVNSMVYFFIPSTDVYGWMPGNKTQSKTVENNTIDFICSSTCSELGPEWWKIGQNDSGCFIGSNDVCMRNTNNSTPMFRYNNRDNTLYKRTGDGTMTSVLSGVKAVYDFYPFSASLNINENTDEENLKIISKQLLDKSTH